MKTLWHGIDQLRHRTAIAGANVRIVLAQTTCDTIDRLGAKQVRALTEDSLGHCALCPSTGDAV
jgi:hypothetical protein